jgi:aldehyde:ferredoxin oxidoreductase
LVNVINAFAGVNFSADDVNDLGKKVLKMERDFNERAGFSSKDDRLPDYFSKEALAPHNVTFQISGQDLDTVYNF